MWLDAAGILAGGVRYDCVAVVAVRLMSMAGTIVAEAARPLLCNICSPLLPCFYKEKMPQHWCAIICGRNRELFIFFSNFNI
jgi:hypothetical protein